MFQYLTSKQLLGLFSHVSLSTLNRYLRTLKSSDKPSIRCLSFWFSPWKWPLAPVYCLTVHGAKYLMQQWSYWPHNIKRPLSRSSFFAVDYYHRLATIDFTISMTKWLKQQNYQLNFIHCYFEREWSNNSHTGNLSKSKAALQCGELQIIPDAIIGYLTAQWSEIILFEQHMGHDSKRAIKQIMWHCWFLSEWVVNQKYGSQKNSRVIYVFEKASCMEAVKQRLTQVSGFAEFAGCFVFTCEVEQLCVFLRK